MFKLTKTIYKICYDNGDDSKNNEQRMSQSTHKAQQKQTSNDCLNCGNVRVINNCKPTRDTIKIIDGSKTGHCVNGVCIDDSNNLNDLNESNKFNNSNNTNNLKCLNIDNNIINEDSDSVNDNTIDFDDCTDSSNEASDGFDDSDETSSNEYY